MNKKAKILVIDDDQDICDWTKSALERTKRFEVFTATKSQEGLNLAKSILPQLIILDVSMPVMDGSQIACALQEDTNTEKIPIIFITGLAQKNELEKNAGMVGGRFFMAKPIENKELISQIDLILQSQK